MRNIELEAWVLRIADQVSAGHRVEDDLVELKSEWPIDPETMARRIAGHANAARGAPILWIIGIDEERGVCGAGPTEVADWFAGVRSEFNDVYPSLQHLNVRVGEKTVVALLFGTERAPFVVKNPMFGSASGGPITLEVPWREGSSTRTATRQDLIRLLAPLTRLPELEFLECKLRVQHEGNPQAIYHWYIEGSLYVIPLDSKRIVFPFHRCSLMATLPDGSTIDLSPQLRLSAPRELEYSPNEGFGHRLDSVTVDSSSSEAVLSGPGRVVLGAGGESPHGPSTVGNADIPIELSLHTVGASTPVILKADLHRFETVGTSGRGWSMRKPQ